MVAKFLTNASGATWCQPMGPLFLWQCFHKSESNQQGLQVWSSTRVPTLTRLTVFTRFQKPLIDRDRHTDEGGIGGPPMGVAKC